eukprot:GILI01032571.1.p1 GENE.GILI01032571.1~~GILI01032571.1.p1  ORF type:complete len:266 (+),score=5.37 GILI01032571.1:123-920(+)
MVWLHSHTLALGCFNGFIKIWDAQSKTVAFSLQQDKTRIDRLERLSDVRIASASTKAINVWNTETGQLEISLPMPLSKINCLIGLPGSNLAFCGDDNSIYIWDYSSNDESSFNNLEGHTNHVTSLALLPNGSQLVSSSLDKTVLVWNWTTGECMRVKKVQKAVSHLVVSNGDLLSYDSSRELTIRSLKDPKQVLIQNHSMQPAASPLPSVRYIFYNSVCVRVLWHPWVSFRPFFLGRLKSHRTGDEVHLLQDLPRSLIRCVLEYF